MEQEFKQSIMSTVSGTRNGDPPGRDQASPVEHYSALSRVAADMDKIFSPLPRPAALEPSVAATDRTADRARRRSRRRRTTLFLGLPLLGLFLLLVAVGLVRPRGKVESSAPILRPSANAVRDVAEPTSPVIIPPAHPPVAHRLASQPKHSERIEKQKRKTLQTQPGQEEKPISPEPTPAQCAAGGGSEAWCLRADTAAADERLRDAYETAVRAHVDRRTLVGINKKWVRLRKRALKDPAGMISGYAALTEELQRQTPPGAPK